MSQGNGNAPQFGIRNNVRQIGRTDVAGWTNGSRERLRVRRSHGPAVRATILDVKDPGPVDAHEPMGCCI